MVLTHIRFHSFCKWVNKTISILAVTSVSSLDISQGPHTYKWKQKRCINYLSTLLSRELIQVSLVWGGISIFPNINKQDRRKLQSTQVLVQALMTLGYTHGRSALHFHESRVSIGNIVCNDPLQTWTMKVHILQMTPQPICPICMRDGKWFHSLGIQNKMHMRQIPSWQENPVIKKVICFLHLQTQRLNLFPLP